jgi:hypothetical protein
MQASPVRQVAQSTVFHWFPFEKRLKISSAGPVQFYLRQTKFTFFSGKIAKIQKTLNQYFGQIISDY